MTVVAGKFSRVRPPRLALALGSIAPDIPLYFLSFGSIYFYTQIKGWEVERTFRHVFQTLFYEHPGWIVPHNFLHAPLLVLMFWAMAIGIHRAGISSARWWCWFFGACWCHSLVDVVTHHDDGPLFFFPWDWSYRFSSPVSYWDPDHFGVVFTILEILMDMLLMILLFVFRKREWGEPVKIT